MSEEHQSSDMVLMPPQRAVADLPPVEDVSHPVAAAMACPKLSDALATARDRCKAASKDGYNDFHKYKYASADEVILTAKEALAGTGLAIIPQAQELTVVSAGNLSLYALNRTIFLSHSSGEYVPLTIRGWPVVPERGRPLDKAFAVALTTSLSYLLRDLLQMPRGDDADMNKRDDTKAQAAPPPAARSETPKADNGLIQKHAKAIEESETVGELAVAWNAVNADSKASRLNAHELGRLNALKETRKKALTPAARPPREPGIDDDEGGPEPTDAELFPHGANDPADQQRKQAATR